MEALKRLQKTTIEMDKIKFINIFNKRLLISDITFQEWTGDFALLYSRRKVAKERAI